MTDTLSKERRSWVMSQVRGKHTKPELRARSLMHRLGYRFTVNGPKNRNLPGKPDIVLPSRRAVVFVHGCFWHRHPGCRLASTPKSNADYWQPKLERNVARDHANEAALLQMGWQVIVIWECELKDLNRLAARLITALPRAPELYPPEELEDQRLVAETQSSYGAARSGASESPKRPKPKARKPKRSPRP